MKQKHSHFTENCCSHDSSSSVEDWDVSPRAGLRYNGDYSGSSNLPKVKMNNLNGNPLEWSHHSSRFFATVDQRPIPDSENLNPLKTLLAGKAKAAISGMDNSGQFYSAARSIVEKLFG